MEYKKLSKKALKYIYTKTIIYNIILLIIIIFTNYYFIKPKDIPIGNTIFILLIIFIVLYTIFIPYITYNRYRYSINEESIDIKEGYLFTKRNIVPIERLHKFEISKGPIEKSFKIERIIVTTAGGDVAIKYLEESEAEHITESLKNIINNLVRKHKKDDDK